MVNDGEAGVVAKREVDEHNVGYLGGRLCEAVGQIWGRGNSVCTAGKRSFDESRRGSVLGDDKDVQWDSEVN